MKRIAIVNQRYGLEVNGGSEYYTRLLAEHLQESFDVTVLTTTALDYDTWENHYPAGTDKIHGVKVLRFPVKHRRNIPLFRIITKCTFVLKKIGIHTDRQWIYAQGPVVPRLLRYVQAHESDYDAFFFVTYLYYSTAMGLPKVAGKSIMIPTAHDEPYIDLPVFRKLFLKSAAILYLTEEEKEFVQHKFQNEHVPHDVIGVGIDLPDELRKPEGVSSAVLKFRVDYQISGEYIIYAGRIDTGKNCEEMFAFFQKYKQKHPDSSMRLVIVGKAVMEVPVHADIHYLGFVSEADKYAAIAGAKWLWLPSRYESLSLALLEGMALGTPGFVNGACEVLKGHCIRSGGAVYYQGYEQFEQKLNEMEHCNKEAYMQMSRQAKRYVEEQYTWGRVEDKICKILNEW